VGSVCGRIPLISTYRTGQFARLSNIPDYQTVPTLLLYSQPLQDLYLSVIFISSYKDFALSIIIGPVTGFPSELIAVKHLYNTLSNYQSIWISGVLASRIKELYCSFQALYLFVILNVCIHFVLLSTFVVCILILAGLYVLHMQ
jgi:hypothetical protein